jgi:hypothetical protein
VLSLQSVLVSSETLGETGFERSGKPEVQAERPLPVEPGGDDDLLCRFGWVPRSVPLGDVDDASEERVDLAVVCRNERVNSMLSPLLELDPNIVLEGLIPSDPSDERREAEVSGIDGRLGGSLDLVPGQEGKDSGWPGVLEVEGRPRSISSKRAEPSRQS